jgi:5-methylcytosine-specific restriction endonuclease McrA
MKKITRNDYEGRRLAIQRALGVDDEEKEITRLYTDEMLCAQEIADRLASAGIPITPRSIQRIVRSRGAVRPVGDAFRLAAQRGRVHWAYKDPRYKTAKRQTSPTVRFNILKRDGYKCALCGNTAQNTILEVDHIIAKCNGGTDEENNLRTLCHDCNVGKRIAERER